MKDITIEQFLATDFIVREKPILAPFHGSFVVADPSLLKPEESVDNKWHMFFHTTFGVFHFASTNGVDFVKVQKIAKRAMRPNINKIGDTYYLYFERTRTLLANALNFVNLAKWRSKIFVVKSKDLINWSKPQPVITKAHGLEDSERGSSISNPFLLKVGDKYRLYFSSGLTFIKDCNFCEPTYICYAESDKPDRDFVVNEKPILSPDKNDPYLNLCSGCLKVYRLKDGYLGVQNGLYEKDGRSHSAILALTSTDGLNYKFAKVLIEPNEADESSWMHQFVYASHLIRVGDKLRIYFNARDVAESIKGRECIGFAEADIK